MENLHNGLWREMGFQMSTCFHAKLLAEPPILKNAPHQLAQVRTRWFGPAMPSKGRNFGGGFFWDVLKRVVNQEAIFGVHKSRHSAPSGSDGRALHGHRLHERPSPTLAPRRQHITVGSTIERQQFGGGKRPI